jgi:hypothetical protein
MIIGINRNREEGLDLEIMTMGREEMKMEKKGNRWRVEREGEIEEDE